MRRTKSKNEEKLLLIDCENCSNKLVEIMCNITDIRPVLILGRAQSLEQYKLDGIQLETHKCLVVNKNAADYVLVYELGRLFGSGEFNKAFILSRDKGFDNIVDHLVLSGLDISRINFGASTDKTISVKSAINVLSDFESGTKLQTIEKRLSMHYIGGRVGACEALDILNSIGLINIRFTKSYQVFFNKNLLIELSTSVK